MSEVDALMIGSYLCGIGTYWCATWIYRFARHLRNYDGGSR